MPLLRIHVDSDPVFVGATDGRHHVQLLYAVEVYPDTVR